MKPFVSILGLDWYIYVYTLIYTDNILIIIPMGFILKYIGIIRGYNIYWLYPDYILRSWSNIDIVSRYLETRVTRDGGMGHGSCQLTAFEVKNWKPWTEMTILTKWKLEVTDVYWLAVWNLFHNILGIIISTDYFFSEGLKPPTRRCSDFHFLIKISSKFMTIIQTHFKAVWRTLLDFAGIQPSLES